MPIKFIEEDSTEPTIGEKAKALAYGAATGFVGGPGELEKFGAYTLPEMVGAREAGARETLAGRETLFPTISEAQKGLAKVGVEKPREAVSGYQTAGEILGGFGTAIPGMLRGGARALFGAPTRTREQYAKAAEDLGFKLSPAQVRADMPVPARGATLQAESNQKLANELASASTGKQVSEISPEFVRGRLRDLGKEFDRLYAGKQFNIDPQAVQAIESIARIEQQLPPSAAVSAVKNTADTILKNYQQMASRTGAQPSTFAIEGDMLQRLRTDLLGAARSATQRQDAHQIYELVDVIDKSVARNHPQIAAKLEQLRPLYRNTIMLEDLVRAGGIKGGDISLERLGTLAVGRKGGVRNTRDLDQLAELGRELGLRARWEPAGRAATAGEDVLGKALGTGADIAGTITGTRSVPARAVQRFYAGRPQPQPLTRLPAATAAGTAVRPLQPEE